jgi:hypothetical protein
VLCRSNFPFERLRTRHRIVTVSSCPAALLLLLVLWAHWKMPLLSASLDAFLFTSLTMIISYLYYASFFHPSAKLVPPSHMHALLNALVLLHTLYILHALTLKYPPNIFQALRLPLTTPTEHIRSALLRASNGKPLTDALENLLTRLGSYEVRTFYVR